MSIPARSEVAMATRSSEGSASVLTPAPDVASPGTMAIADLVARLPNTRQPIADGIPSLELDDAGRPCFVVPTHDGLSAEVWQMLATIEQTGGVEAEARTFLAAQVEPGDLLIDLAAEDGFVALSCAATPAAPHVVARTGSVAAAEALGAAAMDAGFSIEAVAADEAPMIEFAAHAATRALPGHRVFVHLAADMVAAWQESLAAAFAPGTIIAWCVAEAREAPSSQDAIPDAAERLRVAGFASHVLVATDDDLLLTPTDAPDGAFIAIWHDAVGSQQSTDAADTTHASVGVDVAIAEAGHPAARNRIEEATPARTAQPADPALLTTTPGFNWIAPYCRTGYGVAGAYLLRAVAATGAPVAFFPLGTLDRALLPFAGLDDTLARQGDFDPTWPSIRLSQQFDLALHVGRGPRVGFPIFELNRFSARELHHLREQDRLLVCSEWARGVLHENGLWRQPIDIVPLGVDRSVFHEGIPRTAQRPETVFLQVGKIEPRKGQHELLAAFEDAFSARDHVRLVLACHNPFLDGKSLDALLQPFRRSRLASKITLLTAPLPTHADVAQLMANADCGVFASRAEGWNLEVLEMLSCGRTVIATDYSAHTEFLDARNARLIEIDGLESAGAFSDADGEWAAWGASQHDQLVGHLREVHRLKQAGELGINTPGIETARRFTWSHAANALLLSVGAAGH